MESGSPRWRPQPCPFPAITSYKLSLSVPIWKMGECLYQCPGAAIAKHHREWLNNRDFVLSGSGGWKLKVKGLAGLVPPQAVERESAPGPSPSFWGLLVILGVPWLVDASPRSLPSSSHLLPVCNLFSSYRHMSLGLGPTHIIQDMLEIFSDILKGPFPKPGHFHRLQSDILCGGCI